MPFQVFQERLRTVTANTHPGADLAHAR